MKQKHFSGQTLSCWMTAPSHEIRRHKVKSHYDVCIVGAGIAGLSAAYQLAKEGRSVAVFDMGPIGGGQTGRTTAHLASAMDDRFVSLIRHHGEEKTALIYQSHKRAIKEIEKTIAEENIDCDFEYLDGYLFLKEGDSVQSLKKEMQACYKIGFRGVEWVESGPHLNFSSGPALRFPRQAQFHPLKYLFGLAAAVERYRGAIFTNHKVEECVDGTPAHIRLSNGNVITCDAVVVASNTPVNNRFSIHTKQAPYRSYVVAATIPRGSLAPALYWDTEEPYHYVRLWSTPTDSSVAAESRQSSSEELLIVGGEDHKTGQDHRPERHFERLEEWTRTRFPQARDFVFHWSGQVWEPVDSVAFIGRNPGDQNVYIVTGDSGQGMTHGTIAGFLINDLIHQRESEFEDIYSPSRSPMHSPVEYLKENLNVAAQYTDYVALPDHDAVDFCEPGEGVVIQEGLHKTAVYKREDGTELRCSAVCTHLGGIVHWNSVEKSWDCPCHGSRFSPEGKVITGPAVSPLAKAHESTRMRVAATKRERKDPKEYTKTH